MMRETTDIVKSSHAQDARTEPTVSLTTSSYTPRRDYTYDAEAQTESAGYARLQDYWRSVRRHIWIVLGIVALIGSLTALYMARQTDVYEARGRLQVDLEVSNDALSGLKTSSVVLRAPSQDPTYFNTQLQILTSVGLLSRVVKTLDLEHDQAFLAPRSVQKSSTLDNLLKTFGLGRRETPTDDAASVEQSVLPGTLAPAAATNDVAEINRLSPFVERIQGDLTVRQIASTRLIEIRYKHPDPVVAAKITNAISETFVLQNIERKTETGNTAGSFLQQRIAELQSNIRRGEERLINYGKRNSILSLTEDQNTVVQRLVGLNSQLLQAENARKEAESKYNAAQAPGAIVNRAEGAGNSQLANIENRLVEFRQKRAQLLLEYTEIYPEVIDAEKQIALLEQQARDLKTRQTTAISGNLETDYRQAKAYEDSLRAAYEKQRAETLTQNEAAINYRIIQQEIATNTSLLDGLLQRARENDVVLAGTPNNIHIVDHAQKPKAPVGPRRLQAILIAMLFSVGLGVVVARYLDHLDETIHTAEEAELTLRLPTLAVIPATGIGGGGRRLLPSIGGLQKRNNGLINQELLLGNSDARSALAESYRQLRTSILLSSAGGAPKSLLVTSSIPSEGKTTNAINTALILERNGADVLIIDADMRRPRLHSILNIDNSTGLSTVLASTMSEDEMLSLVVKDAESGLHVLTSGPVPPNPAELLGSEQMRNLIKAVEAKFTHVVIDSPPIASFTDGVLISTLVDGVLLVVYGGRTSRNLVRRSKQVLQDVGARIFGIVLNNVTIRSDDYYYKYYHNSYYAETEAENGASDVSSDNR